MKTILSLIRADRYYLLVILSLAFVSVSAVIAFVQSVNIALGN